MKMSIRAHINLIESVQNDAATLEEGTTIGAVISDEDAGNAARILADAGSNKFGASARGQRLIYLAKKIELELQKSSRAPGSITLNMDMSTAVDAADALADGGLPNVANEIRRRANQDGGAGMVRGFSEGEGEMMESDPVALSADQIATTGEDHSASKYPELYEVAMRLANEVCEKINAEARAVESAMPYKAQFILEEMIEILQQRV